METIFKLLIASFSDSDKLLTALFKIENSGESTGLETAKLT